MPVGPVMDSSGAIPLPAYSPGSSKRWLWWVALAAVIPIVFAGYTVGKMLQAKSQPNTSVLSANEQYHPPTILSTEGNQAPPSLEANGDHNPNALANPVEGDTMPDDIRNWLKHLERTEAERSRMTGQQLGQLLALATQMQGKGVMDMLGNIMNDPSGDQGAPELPAADLSGDTEALRKEWTDLGGRFGSLPPPAECVPIRNQYDIALKETSGMVFDIMDILNQATQPGADPQALVGRLTGMKGSSSSIDQAGTKCDQLVQQVCDKYHARKWFTVQGDIGNAGMLRVLGPGM